MQPTYLPWLGYFGMMHSVDLFVLLDTVQFTKRSWQQRNQIRTAAGATWLTVPVLSKGKRDQRINEVEIDMTRDFPRGHTRALELNYRKAPHYAEYAPHLVTLLGGSDGRLSHLTTSTIRWLRDALGITTTLRCASEFEQDGAKADLLAFICDQTGATEYVSPPGSKEYLEESDAFSERGIPVRYFQFDHPEYTQRFQPFLPYMSVVDALFNCGRTSMSLLASASSISPRASQV